MTVSRGTYIRVIGEDLAKKLGTVGYLSSLNRTILNDCVLKESVKPEDLENCHGKIHKIGDFLKHIPKIQLIDEDAKRLMSGQKITDHEFQMPDKSFIRLYRESDFMGIGQCENGILKSVRMLSPS